MLRVGHSSSLRGARFVRQAQGLVEFVLVFPLLLVFLGVVVDLARFFEMRLTLAEMAHDAARYAVIKDAITAAYPTSTKIQARILAQTPTGAPVPSILLGTNASVGGEAAVSLRLTVQMTPLTPGIQSVVGPQATITAEVWYPRR